MDVFHSTRFTLPLPAGHRFPMDKYRLLHERLSVSGAAALSFVEAPAVSLELLAAVHAEDYVRQVCDGSLSARDQRRIGLPWSPALIERARRAAGATVAACDAAMNRGVAVNLAGGTHHAGYARGAGFCVFNDVAIGAVQARASGLAQRVLIVDCDVHQGDGTAELLAGRTGFYTFSIHAARNYPHRKISSDCDIALADGTGDAVYLDALAEGLEHAFSAQRPDLVIYIAGADVYAGDRLGRLAVSKPGIVVRDEMVCAAAAAGGAALAVVMGGGYADLLTDIVDIHYQTVLTVARSHAARRLQDFSGIA